MAEIISSSKLTLEQQQKVRDWVQRISPGGSGNCVFCGKNGWSLSPDLVEVPLFHAGKLIVGGQVVPAFMLVCNTCGHLEFVSAMKAGLIEAGSEPSETQKTIEAKKEERSGK